MVVANWVEKFQSYRITMTIPLFNHAGRIIFLISGQEKAKILKSVMAFRQESGSYPIQLIRPERGQSLWLVDTSAAGQLTMDD